MSIAIAVQLLVAGLSTGSVYALVALGLVLIFKGTGIVNFAYADGSVHGIKPSIDFNTLMALSGFRDGQIITATSTD